MLSVRVEPIEKNILLTLAPELTAEGRSKALAQFARAQLAEAQEINRAASGREPAHHTFVDGARGASEDTVKPDGVIVYEFDLVQDVLAWIGQELLEHSPVLTGRYQRSHILLADGVEVTPGQIPPASLYTFVNTQPYSRKIERGLSDWAPDGVYQAVALLAQRRFGNVAKVKYTFVPINVPQMSPSTSRRERNRMIRDARQPAIQVAPN